MNEHQTKQSEESGSLRRNKHQQKAVKYIWLPTLVYSCLLFCFFPFLNIIFYSSQIPSPAFSFHCFILSVNAIISLFSFMSEKAWKLLTISHGRHHHDQFWLTPLVPPTLSQRDSNLVKVGRSVAVTVTYSNNVALHPGRTVLLLLLWKRASTKNEIKKKSCETKAKTTTGWPGRKEKCNQLKQKRT